MGEEINYAELFGVEIPAEEPQAGQPPETEVPEDTETVQAPEPGTETGTDGGEAPEGEEQPPQPPEESAGDDARQKAQAQHAAAVAKAREDAMREAGKFLDGAIAALGLTDPYTKQPIRTKAEYDAYNAQRQEEQKKRFMRSSGMNQEQFDAFVAGLPEVQQANEAKAKAEQEQQAARQQKARDELENQVKVISKLDPAITDLNSLIKSEGYPKVYKKVQQGYSLEDAYKLVHFDRLSQRNVAAARQQTMNSARGKGHMTQTGSRGTGAPSVPADVMQQYKVFMPDASEEEIRQHYARSVRNK